MNFEEQALQGFRLSPQQRRLWLLPGEGQSYRCCCAVQVEGILQPEVLKKALLTVVGRHEILRTSFRGSPGMRMPLQVVEGSARLDWSMADLSASLTNGRGDLLDQSLFELQGRPFDFRKGPLLQASLLRFEPQDHVLLICLPSLCCDARSLYNLIDETLQAYGELLGGTAPQRDVLQYPDIAAAFNQLGEDAAQVQHWQQGNLSHLLELRLPFESREAGPDEFSPHHLAKAVSQDLLTRLEQLAQTYSTSLPALLVACCQVLFWRLTRKSELIVAAAFEGRSFEGMDEAQGAFARYLPICCSHNEAQAFSEVLTHCRSAMNEASEWQDSFSWQSISASEDQAASGYFALCFDFDEVPSLSAPEHLQVTIVRSDWCFDRFKLRLRCLRRENGMEVELHYNSRLFGEAYAQRIASQFHTLLESVCTDPHKLARRLALLSPKDEIFSNPGHALLTPSRCVHQLFEEQAAAHPDRPALIFDGQCLSYAELNERANRLAQCLKRLGVGPETAVGLLLARSPEQIVGFLGVLKAGGAFIPLDPESPASRLEGQLSDAAADVLVTCRELDHAQPPFSGKVLCLERDCRVTNGRLVADPLPSSQPENLCYLMFTSGSTGSPKGVMVTHANLSGYTLSILHELGLDQDSGKAGLHFALASTFSADLGNTVIYPCLASGGCLHILSRQTATDSARFLEYFSQHSIDVLKIVPSHLSALLAPGARLNLRYLLLGGEMLDHKTANHLHEALEGCRLINHYGPTETTVGSLMLPLQPESAPMRHSSSVPVGRNLANSRSWLLDSEMNPVAGGEAGEIYIGGEGVSRGYAARPALTAFRYRPDPFSDCPGERLYCTGDLARRHPQGEVEILGRADRQVKIRGFRVELGEIEAVLLRHPMVGLAAVTVREDSEGDKRLAAYVTCPRPDAASREALTAYLKQQLPAYMVPGSLDVLNSMPLTPNGKIDRRALPSPESLESRLQGEAAEPRTPAEHILAAIWSLVLGRQPIGVHDNFFDLGGDSIHSIQIAARACQMGLRIAPLQVFQHPTIALLAAVAESDALPESQPQPQQSGDFKRIQLQEGELERILEQVAG